ncbi:hypothetical protein [Massilia sp. TWP1-3-3]|uniref:hypothetical protein n=1 Tax=Massilia sp. TWP1-3-3 TaxID=2804573 RepID=UPI003CEF3A3A
MPSTCIVTLFATLVCLSGLAAAQTSRPVTASARPANAPATPVSLHGAVTVVALEQIKLLALSQADGRAVFAMPDQQLVTVRVGDTVPRTRALLRQILPGKLILEEAGLAGAGSQMVWMHKGQGSAPARIERFGTSAGAAPAVKPPVQVTLTAQGANAVAPPTPVRKP